MNKTLRAVFLGLLALCAFVSTGTGAWAAPTIPQLTGRVVDEAHILPIAVEKDLVAQSRSLEEKTTDQLVVVTLKSLEGYSIEAYGQALGNAWAIGQRGKNNGVLLIVAPKERKVRIEVGTGLESLLDNAASNLILQEKILPRFKKGDMPGGVTAGTYAVIERLYTSPGVETAPAARQTLPDALTPLAPEPAPAPQAVAATPAAGSGDAAMGWVGVLILGGILVLIFKGVAGLMRGSAQTFPSNGYVQPGYGYGSNRGGAGAAFLGGAAGSLAGQAMGSLAGHMLSGHSGSSGVVRGGDDGNLPPDSSFHGGGGSFGGGSGGGGASDSGGGSFSGGGGSFSGGGGASGAGEMLSLADHERIAASVAKAEATTSGEILCATTDTVSDYREVPLGWAAAGALLAPPLLLAAGLQLDSLAALVAGWSTEPTPAAWLIGTYMVVQAAAFLLLRLLVGVPAIRRRLTGRSLVRRRVRQAAVRHFRGAQTLLKPGQPAVLIFAALDERQMEIIADPVIDAAVAPGAWERAAAEAIAVIRKDGPAAGLVRAVELCGAELARAFPDDGRANAAPDQLIEV